MSEFPLGPAPGALWREGFPPPFRVRGQRSQLSVRLRRESFRLGQGGARGPHGRE